VPEIFSFRESFFCCFAILTLESFTHWQAAALGHGFDPDGGGLPE